ncbi:MAG: hypothetical protein HY367_04585 [Candidatus Aenigmarchaeota archaeon]|nr:hypothetical protein [Candidatus Aenigmarchaeota archaeon]
MEYRIERLRESLERAENTGRLNELFNPAYLTMRRNAAEDPYTGIEFDFRDD